MTNDPLSLIRSRRAEIKLLRQKLDAEDADLDQAQRTIMRLAQMPTGNGADNTSLAPKTQKEFVIHTLKNSESPWFVSVRALRDEIAKLGRDIPMSTFQPLISDLTKKEIVARDGSKIGLAERTGS
jgi:hypothetical protein